jgi:hypothetical protein
METAKKILLIFLVVLLVGGTSYGSFYFLKKYFTKPSIKQSTTLTQTEDSIPGFKRDTTNSILTYFPKGLVLEKDIKNILESFVVVQDDNTQYTLRYISTNIWSDNFFAFNRLLISKGWNLGTKIQGKVTNLTYTLHKDTLYINSSEVKDVGNLIDITLVTR